MGACISKYRPHPSSSIEPCDPQDKLVISQSPATSLNPIKDDFSKDQSPSSNTTSFLSTGSTSSSSCSSFFSPKIGSFSSERMFTLHQRSQIDILDPSKHSHAKPKPVAFPIQSSQPKSMSPLVPSKQSSADINQALPSKRTRSFSQASLARQKSFSGERSSVAHPPGLQPRYSRPSDRPVKGAFRDVTRNVVKERNRLGVQRPRTITPRPINEGNEKLCHWNSNSQSSYLAEEMHACGIQQFHSQASQNGSREMLSKQRSSGTPFMEDFDNPLISMDCFIFL